jgi:hypothetical protein
MGIMITLKKPTPESPPCPRRRQPPWPHALRRDPARPGAAAPAGGRPCCRHCLTTAAGASTTSSLAPRGSRTWACAGNKRPSAPLILMSLRGKRGGHSRGRSVDAQRTRRQPSCGLALQPVGRRGARARTRGHGAASHPRSRPQASAKGPRSAACSMPALGTAFLQGRTVASTPLPPWPCARAFWSKPPHPSSSGRLGRRLTRAPSRKPAAPSTQPGCRSSSGRPMRRTPIRGKSSGRRAHRRRPICPPSRLWRGGLRRASRRYAS